MPITSIISQPSSNTLNAAYRPVVLCVLATATDTTARPPVVYCDIYFNNVYYKSLAKTHYTKLNPSNSEWQFQIEDAAQEYLQKMIGANGGTEIIDFSNHVLKCFCRFRSSGFDADGFIATENTAPVQGTGSTAPTAGTGYQSNSFFIMNAALQHEDNQNLQSHLTSYKNGFWDSFAYPGTHRSNNYRIALSNSDYFPLVDTAERALKCLTLFYRYKGQNTFLQKQYCYCVPLAAPSYTLPDAYVASPYIYSITLTGDAPFALTVVSKPSWMTIAITGSTINFTGTPAGGDVDTDVTVSFTVSNCSAVNSLSFSDTIDVEADIPACIPVSIPSVTLPDAVVGDAYSYSIALTGTSPFALSSIVKPAWMTIAVSGSNINFTGTPDSADESAGVAVSFTVSNCSGANTADFSDSIDVSINWMTQPCWRHELQNTNDYTITISYRNCTNGAIETTTIGVGEIILLCALAYSVLSADPLSLISTELC